MNVKTIQQRGGLSSLRTIGVVTLMLALAIFLASCAEEEASGGGEESVPSGEEAESGGQAVGVSVADVTDNPSEFYGTDATLSGAVTEVVGPNAVAIGGGELIGGEQVLILGAQQLDQIVEGLPEGEPFEVQQQDLVQASGTLQEFNLEEVGNQVGYELDDNLFGDWEGETVLVADSFILTPQQGGDATTMEQGVNATLPLITDSPEEFYGQTVTVSGAVAQVIDPNTFVIVDQQSAEDEGLYDVAAGTLAEQGILVSTSNGPNLTERQTVEVTGALQQFDTETFEQELGVTYDTNDEYISGFSDGRPAIMADQVQVQGEETTSQ